MSVGRLFTKLKPPKKQFIVQVTAELDDSKDEDGFAEAATFQFIVDEDDMKVFQRVLNANGYLYVVQPMEGEYPDATY